MTTTPETRVSGSTAVVVYVSSDEPLFVIPGGTKPITRPLAVTRLRINYSGRFANVTASGTYVKKDGTPGVAPGHHSFLGGERSAYWSLVEQYVEAHRPPPFVTAYKPNNDPLHA